MAAKTILLRDAVARLHQFVGGQRPLRRDRTQDRLFIAELKSDYAPGNLCFIRLREDLESRRKLGMRNQVRAHVVTVSLWILWPADRGVSVDFQYQ